MNITDITKKSIQTIAKNGEPITPIIFFDTFCSEARRNKVAVEDCEVIKNYIEKLDPSLKNDIQKYNIKNIKEFLSYLVSSLNRLNGNQLAIRYSSLLELSKKIVEAISMIDNKELEELSGRTNGLLNRTHSPENLDDIKREWMRFSSSYKKERNRDRLGKYISFDKSDDLDSILDKVIPLLEDNSKQKDSLTHSQRVVDLMFNSLNPSLVANENREIESLYRKVRTNPSLIYNRDIQDEIEKYYHKRVDTDRSEEISLLSRTGKIIGSLVDLDSTNNSNIDNNKLENIDEVVNDFNSISQDLASENEKKDSGFFARFSSKIENVKNSALTLFSRIKRYSDTINDAKNQFENIQSETFIKRANADQDFLTKMKNKKGMEKDINEAETRYISKNENYSIVVIDIDRFLEINKRYGNDAGDLIIKYFSKILKDYVSRNNSVARYGDDNFIVLLSNHSLNEALLLANKFREKVKHTKFVYKEERVNITFSAGISDRFGSESLHSTMDRAMSRVQEAKDGGRDRIIPEPISQNIVDPEIKTSATIVV